MLKSILLELLCELDSKEMKEFTKFVASPFFNKNPNVIKLLSLIKKYHPEFESKKAGTNLQKEKVYVSIFPKKSYNDSTMRTLIHDLQKLAEEFLIYKEISKDRVRMNIYLLNNLYSKENLKLLEKKTIETDKLIDSSEFKEADYYLNKSEIEAFKNFVYGYDFTYKKGFEPPESIYYQSEFTIYYFLLVIMRQYYFLLNEGIILNYTPQLDFLAGIIEFLKDNPQYLKNPIIEFRYYLILLLKEMDDKNFHKVKKILFEKNKGLPAYDNFNACAIMQNFCKFKYQSSMDKKYMYECFELERFALENHYYSTKSSEEIRSFRFMNIVHTALSVAQLDWAEEFIEQYKEKLKPDVRDEVVDLSLATLNFARGNYQSALDMVSRINKYPDILFNLSVRNLNLMIHFELNWTDSAASALDAYRHFLSKDKLLPAWRKQLYQNFFKIYNELLKIKDDLPARRRVNRSDKLNELKHMLMGPVPVDTRDWFLEKINELK